MGMDHDNQEQAGLVDFNTFADAAEITRRAEIQLQDMEFKGEMAIETGSVYGAVIAIPQVARCMAWNQTFMALVWRSFLLLVVNYIFQFAALIFISEESQVMDALGGKMHLCDYGKQLDHCTASKLGCVGPGGTLFSAPRLYSFDVWNLRTWARDEMVATFPDKKDIIMSTMDPGEYGMENYWCRIFACFLFTLAEVQSFFQILDLVAILVYVPTKAESWVYYDEDGDEHDPLSAIRFRVAGMPLGWKIFNAVIVVFPKTFLLFEVYWMGFRFLMDTAGMIDLVLGAMAMDFILTFDELLLESFGTEATKHIMDDLEHFTADATDEEDYHADLASGGWKVKLGALMLCVPRRLIIVLVVLAIFIQLYYRVHCDIDVNGSWVSKPRMLPNSTVYTFMNLITNKIPEAGFAWQPKPMVQ